MNNYTPEEIEAAKKAGYYITPESVEGFREDVLPLTGDRSKRTRDAYSEYLLALRGGLQKSPLAGQKRHSSPFSMMPEAMLANLGLTKSGHGMPVEYAPVGDEKYEMWKPGERPPEPVRDAWSLLQHGIKTKDTRAISIAKKRLKELGYTENRLSELNRLRVSVPVEEKHLLDPEYQREQWRSSPQYQEHINRGAFIAPPNVLGIS